MSDGEIELSLGTRIPMRDGVRLNANIYRPRRQSGSRPALLMMTPYIADTHHMRARRFAEDGWPFALVDVRGRGNSEGTFRPYIQEAKDAHDLVEWLADQPWCNGKVAMLGASYLGYCQWAAAKECPTHLAAIVPAAAPYAGADFPMRNNVRYPFIQQWLTFTAGRAGQFQLFSDQSFWSDHYRRWYESGQSFRTLDSATGLPSDAFQEWLDYPEIGEHWDQYNPSPSDYAAISFPVLTITGSYDDDQPGALTHYREHMRHSDPTARQKHFLVIGPWDHLGTSIPRAEFGGIKVGEDSLVDMVELHEQWFDWVLMGGPRPAFLRDQVAYYVMGADRWRYAASLEDATAGCLTLYLDSKGQADDIFSSGTLASAPGSGDPDTYTFDPRTSEKLFLDSEGRADGASLTDQALLHTLRGQQCVYHSAPFDQTVEVTGQFRLTAWLSINSPDTDFYVSVHEIAIDGSAIRLSTDVLRARYLNGLNQAELIDSEDPRQYAFERFTFISRQIAKGHRLRLVVAPIGRIIEGTFVQKNFNGGGIVAEETAEDGQAVTVRVFHDAERPSVLYVPIGRSSD